MCCLPKAKGAFPKAIRIDRQAVVGNKQLDKATMICIVWLPYI